MTARPWVQAGLWGSGTVRKRMRSAQSCWGEPLQILGSRPASWILKEHIFLILQATFQRQSCRLPHRKISLYSKNEATKQGLAQPSESPEDLIQTTKEGGKAQGTVWLLLKAVAVTFLINRASLQGTEERSPTPLPEEVGSPVTKTPNSQHWLRGPGLELGARAWIFPERILGVEKGGGGNKDCVC